MQCKGIVAGIVFIDAFREGFQDIFIHGEAGCAVTIYLGAGYILEQLFAVVQILFEFRWILIVAEYVLLPVRGYFTSFTESAWLHPAANEPPDCDCS